MYEFSKKFNVVGLDLSDKKNKRTKSNGVDSTDDFYSAEGSLIIKNLKLEFTYKHDPYGQIAISSLNLKQFLLLYDESNRPDMTSF